VTSTLPALEAALDAAAHRHYGTQRRPSWRPPALAGAVGAAVLLLALPGRTGIPARAPLPPVPAETLALSQALANGPGVPAHRIGDPVVAHAELPTIADAFEDQTP
jgi:hypothetical protein